MSEEYLIWREVDSKVNRKTTPPARSEIKLGQRVWALEKRNYASGELTEGVVKRILTKKPYHPRGIKVMFEDGTVARVQCLTPPERKVPVDLDEEGELR